jgi:hypothetical protein
MFLVKLVSLIFKFIITITIQPLYDAFPSHGSSGVQVELYGETLRDLLADSSSTELSIHRSADFGYHVAGAVTHNVHSGAELQRVIDKGVVGRVRQ